MELDPPVFEVHATSRPGGVVAQSKLWGLAKDPEIGV
jgi:hypothetical protein